MTYIENEARYEAAIRNRIKQNAMTTWLRNDATRSALMDALQDEAHRRGPDSFMGKMFDSLMQWGKLSEKQEAAVRKILAGNDAKRAQWAAERRARDAVSTHQGVVGARGVYALTVRFVASFENQFGTMYVTGMADEAGNVFVYKGGVQLAERGQQVHFTATVKAHETRDGVAQTILARPAKVTVSEGA